MNPKEPLTPDPDIRLSHGMDFGQPSDETLPEVEEAVRQMPERPSRPERRGWRQKAWDRHYGDTRPDASRGEQE